MSNVRDVVHLSPRKFDVRTLPADLQRLYKSLADESNSETYDEEYALLIIFAIRTAVELHRAWHMTLLTNKILNQLVARFKLHRLSWNLSVFRLNFRVQGVAGQSSVEIHRRVPYDYDSEYQDIYYRTAVALMDDEITVDEALIYQSETLAGKHTAASGKFLRDPPGRLLLYPLVAATCAVIFFTGDWTDFGVAAITGFASGVVEYCLGMLPGAGPMVDVLVGTTTGLIGGLWYRYQGESVCLSAIFLGTLYWYFYGTAFVLGILEVISGDLEVGVTRFVAVAVKTFVLCLGAAFGLLVVGNATEVWFAQADNCARIDLDEVWWRIPLYLLCSVAVLGQYRFPVLRYWRALVVMLVAYEVQYELFNYFATIYDRDNLDTATSNVFGSAAAVVSACAVSYWVNQLRYYSDARILRADEKSSCFGNFVYHIMALGVRIGHVLRIGRASDKDKLDLEKKLAKAAKERKDGNEPIKLEPYEEDLVMETIVGSQDMNIWSVLMPALYQLVPGSMIAKFWFNYIFPPPLVERVENEGTDSEYKTYHIDEQANNVFAGLMIISTSLALGLIFGFAVVQVLDWFFGLRLWGSCFQDKLKTTEKKKRAQSRRGGMYTSPATKDDDPQSVAEEFRRIVLREGGGTAITQAEADEIFYALDLDGSGAIDKVEVEYYMAKAGMSQEQIEKLFSKMDKDGNGEVTRSEFRRAVLDDSFDANLLKPQEDLAKEAPQATPADAVAAEEATA